MSKRVLLLIIHLAVYLSVIANDKGVLITHTDESTTFLPLEKEIKVTFTDNKTLKFSGLGIDDLELKVSDVLRFTISENPTGIDAMEFPSIQIDISERMITLSGLPQGQTVRLFNVNGTIENISTADSHCNVLIDTRNLAQGVYILSVTNGRTYKIIKK